MTFSHKKNQGPGKISAAGSKKKQRFAPHDKEKQGTMAVAKEKQGPSPLP